MNAIQYNLLTPDNCLIVNDWKIGPYAISYSGGVDGVLLQTGLNHEIAFNETTVYWWSLIDINHDEYLICLQKEEKGPAFFLFSNLVEVKDFLQNIFSITFSSGDHAIDHAIKNNVLVLNKHIESVAINPSFFVDPDLCCCVTSYSDDVKELSNNYVCLIGKDTIVDSSFDFSLGEQAFLYSEYNCLTSSTPQTTINFWLDNNHPYKDSLYTILFAPVNSAENPDVYWILTQSENYLFFNDIQICDKFATGEVWCNVCLILDMDLGNEIIEVSVYIDGDYASTTSVSQSEWPAVMSGISFSGICRHSSVPYIGRLGHIMIYDRILSENEITNNYDVLSYKYVV